MNEIPMKRIIRWYISVFIVFAILFVIQPYNVMAETGSITINDIRQYEYKSSFFDTGRTMDWENISFFNSSYNSIADIRLNITNLAVPAGLVIYFNQSFETTTFTIVSGGSGSGVAYYDENLSSLYWVCTPDCSVTSSTVRLQYAKNIFNNITASTTVPVCARSLNCFGDWFTDVVTVSRPAGFKATNGIVASWYYRTNLGSHDTDTYNVTYFSGGGNQYFTASIYKGQGVSKKYIFESQTAEYSRETTFNKNNINATNIYADGLYFNITLQSGYHLTTLINSTGVSGFVPPPTVNPLTDVGITFDASSYNIGATANISWIRNNPTPFGMQDKIYLTHPGNIKKLLASDPTDIGYTKTNDLPIAGEYNVSFERSIPPFELFIEVLASDTANVVNEQPSYILVNETVPVGVYTSGTYLYGWNGTGRIVIYEDMTDGTIKEIDSLAISATCCIEQTVSQLFFPEAGNYRVVLMKGYDTVRATASVRAYFSDIIPGRNITVSNISTNKNQYTYGEPYTITYQVDSFNYSTKSKRIIAYDPTTGANTLVTQVPAQTGSITRTFDSEMFPFSGALEFRLMGLNATGDYLLANVSFTLSKIDTEGYGLDVTKSPICSGETGFYTYYSPGAVTITMSNKDVTVYSRNFTSAVSGKTVPFTIRNPGTYEIFLRASNETDVKFTKIVEVKACDATASTNPITQAKAQNDVALLLTSSFIWALIITVGLMIAVGIEMRQQRSDALIPMVAIGFLSLAAFTWLTWIPAVVFWSIVLLLAVIFAWQRAKDMNTAGE